MWKKNSYEYAVPDIILDCRKIALKIELFKCNVYTVKLSEKNNHRTNGLMVFYVRLL